jgi:hypothetical protein
MAARTLHLHVQGEPIMGQRTFFERFGHHGVCVLPDDVLSDDPLTDPVTGEELLSLRDQVCQAIGIHHSMLYYARVLRTCGDSLYWADIAATPDLVNAFQVILSEEDLYFALPYDVRVQDKRPAQILKMMAVHEREVRPAQRIVPETAIEPAPAPALPLKPLAVVEVSNEELQEAIKPLIKNIHRKTIRQGVFRSISSVSLQQAFLQVIIDVLMSELYWTQQACESVRSCRIRMQCTIVSCLQHWQRHSRQRCVNAVPIWRDEQRAVMWQLTVGGPLTRLVAA